MQRHHSQSRFKARARLGGVALLAAALAACAGKPGGPVPYDVAGFGAPDQPSVEPAAGFVIGPTDNLSIKVFGVEDMSGEYSVDTSGRIAFPLVGAVSVAGLTVEAAADQIEARLRPYLRQPDVAVALKDSPRLTFAVEGAVRQPGLYPIRTPMSLLQAVASARGTSEDANVHRVAVFRTIGGQRNAAAFDLGLIRTGQKPDPQVYPGDVIVVDDSAGARLRREILQALPALGVFTPLAR